MKTDYLLSISRCIEFHEIFFKKKVQCNFFHFGVFSWNCCMLIFLPKPSNILRESNWNTLEKPIRHKTKWIQITSMKLSFWAQSYFLSFCTLLVVSKWKQMKEKLQRSLQKRKEEGDEVTAIAFVVWNRKKLSIANPATIICGDYVKSLTKICSRTDWLIIRRK